MRPGGGSRPGWPGPKWTCHSRSGRPARRSRPAPRTGRRQRTARSRLGHGPARRAAARSRARGQAPDLASAVGHPADRADQQGQRRRGQDRQPPSAAQEKIGAGADHAAERGLRRGQSGTQEGERRFREHRLAELQDGQRAQGRRDVGQDVAGEDLARRPPHQPGRLNVGQLALGAGERPGGTGIGSPAHGTERHDDDERTGALAPFDRDGVPQERGQDQRYQHRVERQRGVRGAHRQPIQRAADMAGPKPQEAAGRQRQRQRPSR